jgi:heat shock protein HtpX
MNIGRKRELRGLMAHELAHVKHRGILISTIAALLIALLALMAAGLMQKSISRIRDYEADRSGAEIAQDPEAIAPIA